MNEISHKIILSTEKYEGLCLDDVESELAKGFYQFMMRLRRTQLSLIEKYHPADEMRCPIHFCVGQEATPAALSFIISEKDFLFSHHRSHGYFFAKKGPMKNLFAELYGRATGTNGGMAGSQELSVPAANFFSGAIITGAVAIAVGVALSFKLKKRPNIIFACFGDAATEEGAFWEAISYSVLQKLPIVFICENNRYSTYSPQYKRQAADDIHKRIEAFGVTSKGLFGNDVIALYNVMCSAVEYVKKGQGPFFIEAYTYRWNGHVGPEDDDYIGYRPASELTFWKSNCPISLLEEKIIANGLITKQEKQMIIDEIETEISQAFAFAKQSPFPEKADWRRSNYNDTAPLAERLLHDGTQCDDFDYNQGDAIPKPY